MLNLNQEKFTKIIKIFQISDIEEMTSKLREISMDADNRFSIFSLIQMMDSFVILHDDKEETKTRYITFKDDEMKNYLILSAGRSIEDLRFDAACMLRKLLKGMNDSRKKMSFNHSVNNENFSREDKYFACAILMPKKSVIKFITSKDEKGNYLFLNEKNEISFKNINFVAEHFGVPYRKCCSRLFHLFQNLQESGKYNFQIEGCTNKRKFKEELEKYTEECRKRDYKELIKNSEENRIRRTNHLLNSLHYRSYSRLSDVAKRRILVNLAKFDSVNEGVVKTEQEAKDIINNYIASGGNVVDGKLITKNGEITLSNEQLVVLGEYDLYKKALEQGFLKNIVETNYKLKDIKDLKYIDALNKITEGDLAYYICMLHSGLFKYLSNKYGEERGGNYRTAPVALVGTTVSTCEPFMIRQTVENICWRILNVLKTHAKGELSNTEYIERINECIYEIIRAQPFPDGNKRTARLLSNILYQEGGMPFVLLPVKEWDSYVDAWSSDDTKKYNELMKKLIFESYEYFYGDQSANEAAKNIAQNTKIITSNSKR